MDLHSDAVDFSCNLSQIAIDLLQFAINIQPETK